MNKTAYRIIFNQYRNILMAVPETAQTHGKVNKTGSKMRRLWGVFTPMAFALFCAFQPVAVTPAQAAGIVTDKSAPQTQQPQVLNAANGVPIVNIQTPSKAGVSYNKYQQFDVSAEGAILNNSRQNTQATLGGYVMANPNLLGGTAKVILNEVNSSNPSYLNGMVEIAGSKAQLVIANPAGISCAGCGFMNAHRVTLTTGIPQMQDGNLTGFIVNNGMITIAGQMNNTEVDYTELIARSVTVNAKLWANNLSVIAGRNQVDYETLAVTPLSPANDTPEFGIDVSALGGMYAGKITLIGTEAGVGVRNAGEIGASAGDIAITVNGRLVNTNQIESQTGNIAIAANGQVNNSGQILAQGASHTIEATGSIINSGNIGITDGTLILSTSGALTNSGQIFSRTGTLTVEQNITNSGEITSHGGPLFIQTNANLNNSDKIIAQNGNIDLIVQGNIQNSGLLGAITGNATIQGYAALDNQGQIFAQDGSHSLTIATDIQNSGNITASNGDLSLQTVGFLSNSGQIIAQQGNQNLQVVNGIVNNGIIGSLNGYLAVQTAGLLSNLNQIIAQSGSVTINANAGISNSGDIGTTAGQLTLSTTGSIINSGNIGATDGALILSTNGTLTNSGQIFSRTGTLTVEQNITNSGEITSYGGPLFIQTNANLSNSDKIIAQNGNIDLIVQGDIQNSGLLGAITGNATIQGYAALDNQGQIFAQDGSHSLTIATDIQNSGNITASNGDLNLQTAGLLSNSGQIIAQSGGATINADAGISNSGDIGTTAGLTLSTTGSVDNAGQILSQSDSAIIQAQYLNNSNTIYAKNLTLNIQDTIQNQRNIIAGNMIANTQTLHNTGEISANTNFTLNADTLNNTGNLYAIDGQNTLNVKTVNNQSLIYGNSVAVDSEILGNSGTIVAIGDLAIRNAGTLDNTGLINSATGTATINTSLLNNTGTGKIYGDDILLSADILNNLADGDAAPVIAARGDLLIGTNDLYNANHALIFSSGDLLIGRQIDAAGRTITGQANRIQNDSATLESLGNMTLNVATLLNQNLDFATHDVEVSREQIIEYSIKGSYNRYTPDEVWWTNNEVNQLYTPDGDMSENYYMYDYTRVIVETQILRSDPGKILAGGNMVINGGAVINDNSQIMAGASLLMNADLTNMETTGERLTTETGNLHEYWRQRKKGTDGQGHSSTAYTPADIVETISLNAAPVGSYQQISSASPTIPGQSPASSSEDGSSLTVPGQTPLSGGQGTLDLSRLPSGLFQQNTDPNIDRYLIITDPAFASYRVWLSSDYFFEQLQNDPAYNLKRVGDGFFEQQMLRNQIMALTGYRFLEGYSSDEEQYRALMDSGIAYGKEWNLALGVALTAEQISALTSPIVWMVNETVTLPDGTTATALMPKVYGPLDQPAGTALISAKDVQINSTGTLNNKATIAAYDQLNLRADTINNNGNILGNNIDMRAIQDINHLGGTISADSSVLLYAGNNVNIISQTNQTFSEQGSRTNIDRVASVTVTGKGDGNGDMAIVAGNDININAGSLANLSQSGSTALVADNNINLGTVTTAFSQSNVRDADNWRNESHTAEVGSSIQTQGDIIMSAGNDLNIKGAAIYSEAGNLVGQAGNNINITAGRSTDQVDDAHKHTDSNSSFSKTTRTLIDHVFDASANGSSLSAENITLQAGHDLNVQGSNVVASNNVNLSAANDINITAAVEESDSLHYRNEKKSGMFSSGLSVTIGTQEQTLENTQKSTTAYGSTIGSLQGNVNIDAGHTYNQVGSAVKTPGGDINISAGEINITPSQEHWSDEQKYTYKQSGLTIAISNPVINAIQIADRMRAAKGQTSNKRAQALADATSVMAAYNAYDNVMNQNGGADASTGGGIHVSVTIGNSQSKSTITSSGIDNIGSELQAGGNINLTAKNDADHSGSGNINIIGSNITAKNDVNLTAQNDINLLASQDTSTMDRSSSGSSAGIGVAVSFGSNGWAIGFTANASGSRGKGEGNDALWNNTYIKAGNNLNITSGNDTNMIGAVASGNTVNTNIGGNLHIQSVQDEHNYKSKDESLGGSITVGFGVSGSASYQKSKINSKYTSVQEQSGIKAGDGGFNVYVGRHTQLDGAVISSNQVAIDENRNHFSTGTLGTSDIRNEAHYDASSVGISGSGSIAGSGNSSHLLGSGQTGASAGAPSVITDSGQNSSTTGSGISAGDLEIRDKEGQLALTGKTAEETLANLDQTVTSEKDGSNALKEIFNEQEILANIAISQAFVDETQKFAQGMAQKADAAKKVLDAAKAQYDTDPSEANLQALLQANQTYEDAKLWAPGGTYSQILTAITAAAGSNVSGSLGELGTNALVNYIQGLGAQQVKALADSLLDANGNKTAESEVVRALLQGVIACAGSAAQGGDCASGALGAAGSVALNNLLDSVLKQDPKDMTEQEKLDRENLVGSILTGVAESTGGSAKDALTGSTIEIENNQIKYRSGTSPRIIAAGDIVAKALEKGNNITKQELIDTLKQLDTLANSGNLTMQEQMNLSSFVLALMTQASSAGLLTPDQVFSDPKMIGNAIVSMGFSGGGISKIPGEGPTTSTSVSRGKGSAANLTAEQQQIIKNAETISTAKSGLQSTQPRDLNEQILWKQIQTNPSSGNKLTGMNNDPRFPPSAGFQKMEVTHDLPNGQSISVHYQYNIYTGKVYDMKVVTPKSNGLF